MIKQSELRVSISNGLQTTPRQVTRAGVVDQQVWQGAEITLHNASSERIGWANVDIYLLHNRAVISDPVDYGFELYLSGAEIVPVQLGSFTVGERKSHSVRYKSHYDARGHKGLAKQYKLLRIYGETSDGQKFMFDLAAGDVPKLGTKRKWCFIANAAFEDEGHPTVDELRRVRDEVLRPTRAGRAFIKFYYRHSPRVAAWMATRPRIKRATRAVLTPLARSTRAVSALRREGWRSLFQNNL